MRIDRRLLGHFDLVTLTVTILLVIVGIVSIYSATFLNSPGIFRREIYWFAVGLVLLITASLVHYYLIERFAYLFYGITVVLLLLVFVTGKSGGGATRWLGFGPLTFQPSELAKLSLIAVLARYLSLETRRPGGLGIRSLIVPGIMMFIPFFLVAKEPDLGTALLLGLIFSSMVLVAGIRPGALALLAGAAAVSAPVAWLGLKDYQRARLTAFLSPESDPFGSGYHILQSKIAIGSGGLIGKGFTKGTQGKLMFLPEHHTDFIFSIFAEEWGLLGVLAILTLFLILILRGLQTASSARDRFAFFTAFGITSMFFWHVAINLGMVSGLLPVVGVPLPFLSYGGSFLAVSMIGAGILINIRTRSFIF